MATNSYRQLIVALFGQRSETREQVVSGLDPIFRRKWQRLWKAIRLDQNMSKFLMLGPPFRIGTIMQVAQEYARGTFILLAPTVPNKQQRNKIWIYCLRGRRETMSSSTVA